MKIELSKEEIELLLDLINCGYHKCRKDHNVGRILIMKLYDKIKGEEKNDEYYIKWEKENKFKVLLDDMEVRDTI